MGKSIHALKMETLDLHCSSCTTLPLYPVPLIQFLGFGVCLTPEELRPRFKANHLEVGQNLCCSGLAEHCQNDMQRPRKGNHTP